MVITGTPANGVSTRQRGTISPIEVLRDVLRQSPQLDTYVADLDRETAQSHEDRAVVRKAIGEILFERMAYDKAVTQLKLAAELMPADAVIYSKLVACYDGLADRPAAVDQLFASLEITRRDV
jgi:Flp pilus assembly protein TadD